MVVTLGIPDFPTPLSVCLPTVRHARSGQDNNEAAFKFLEKSTAQIDALVCSIGFN